MRVMVEDKFSLDDMFILIVRPSELNEGEGADALAWLELVKRKLARSIQRKTQPEQGVKHG